MENFLSTTTEGTFNGQERLREASNSKLQSGKRGASKATKSVGKKGTIYRKVILKNSQRSRPPHLNEGKKRKKSRGWGNKKDVALG